MDILIDGYNLLHQSPFLTTDRGPGWLARARTRLLVFLQSHQTTPPKAITIVFDSKESHGLQDREQFHSIEVLFAQGHEEADDLLEHLISKHSHPRSLVVVSADHRVQKAARRRDAQALDGDIWLDRWERPVGHPHHPDSSHDEDPKGPVQPTDTQAWLEEFGFDGDEH